MPPRLSREPRVHTSLFDYILQGFTKIPLIGPLIQAITGISGGGYGDLTNYFDNLGTHVQVTTDTLGDLQDKTQKLLNVIGYAHAYAVGGISATVGERRYDMSNQIGPIVGVQLTNGIMLLESKGLWVANAHCYFDFLNAGVTKVDITIKVFDPQGNLWAERISEIDSNDECSLQVHLPFTVPTAGYGVMLYVNAALGRGVFGGQKYNGLDVTKVSGETS